MKNYKYLYLIISFLCITSCIDKSNNKESKPNKSQSISTYKEWIDFEISQENKFFFDEDISSTFADLLIFKLDITPTVYIEHYLGSKDGSLKKVSDSLLENKRLLDKINLLREQADSLSKINNPLLGYDQEHYTIPVIKPKYFRDDTALRKLLSFETKEFKHETWTEYYLWIDTLGNVERFHCIKKSTPSVNLNCEEIIKQLKFTSAFHAKDLRRKDLRANDNLYKVPSRINLKFKINSSMLEKEELE